MYAGGSKHIHLFHYSLLNRSKNVIRLSSSSSAASQALNIVLWPRIVRLERLHMTQEMLSEAREASDVRAQDNASQAAINHHSPAATFLGSMAKGNHCFAVDTLDCA